MRAGAGNYLRKKSGARREMCLQSRGSHVIIANVRVKNRGVNVLANHKSALKRVGITAKKNLRNRMITSQVKTAVKSFDQTLASDDQAAINAAYVNAVSTVDKAAAKGVIHKNAANRKKAQLAVKLAAK